MNTRTTFALLGFVAFAAAACSGKDTTQVTPPDTTTDSTVTPPPPPPPPPSGVATLFAAGNISKCTNDNDELTAELIDSVPAATVVTLGNNANPLGTLDNYTTCYGPTWGRFKARTYGSIGNHDYDSSGSAAGFFGYFGDRGGPAGKGYYSFDTGAWHVIVLNSNGTQVPYNSTSEQQAWLQTDLDAHKTTKCIMAVWHHARFFSSNTAGFNERTTFASLWNRLYAGGVDVIVNGSEYFYERMYPMMPDGSRNDSTGIRQFNVGTGGESLQGASNVAPNDANFLAAYGVLKFTLRADSYDYRFIPVRGESATDAGSGTCR